MASRTLTTKTHSNATTRKLAQKKICVGKRARTCGRTPGCKLASGKKRQFCRTSKNMNMGNASTCRGKRARTCGRTVGCKLASGKKRQFCRTSKNKKH